MEATEDEAVEATTTIEDRNMVDNIVSGSNNKIRGSNNKNHICGLLTHRGSIGDNNHGLLLLVPTPPHHGLVHHLLVNPGIPPRYIQGTLDYGLHLSKSSI
ncbi:hypothetical protein A2U01_0067664, partial [Trifolium medium]|nr:hypothetical protein [Trifolium medium]